MDGEHIFVRLSLFAYLNCAEESDFSVKRTFLDRVADVLALRLH